jgi:glucose/arabinose dehydrogenase
MLRGAHGEILLADGGLDAWAAAADHKSPPGKQGVIYVFPDGSAAHRKTLLKGLNRPYGLALWQNYLYVAEADSIKRYRYDPVHLAVGRGQEVISLAGFNDGHWTRSLLFSPDGRKLYVGVGSESNVATGEDPRRAAINRYNPDGSGHEIFAAGLRNPVGLRWYPHTDCLWTSVEERDNLGDNLVPDYFTPVAQGGFYGWPYSYIGSHKDPRITNQQDDLVSIALVPEVLLGAHVAVLDFLFYTGRQFPSEYRGGAFLAFHGSWNRSRRVGYEVAFLPFRNGNPHGRWREFLTGWMLSPDRKEVWGRPVGILQMADGSLLVSDDGGRKIWRVTYSAAR